MHNITLIALDKIKKIEIRELCNEYIKRLSAFCNFKELFGKYNIDIHSDILKQIRVLPTK